MRKALALLVALAGGCVGGPWRGAGGGSSQSGGPGPAPADVEAIARDYRDFLDAARTSAWATTYTVRRSGFRVLDPLAGDSHKLVPGDRLVFPGHDHTALFVVIGKRPLSAGGRLIGAHIDTPAPRLDLHALARDGQVELHARRYGGTKQYQWLSRPLAVVGQVAAAGGRVVDVSLGLDADDFALWATDLSPEGVLTVIGSSTPSEDGPGGAARTLMTALWDRYHLTAADLGAAELYLVPRAHARDVGLDRSLIGSHGQDDRADSYVAWRAIVDLAGVPEHTALVWLVDREEAGSTGASGARSQFLELVYAYLLRAERGAVRPIDLQRAFAATVALSADTPACADPNWPEVHEVKHAPVAGQGPAMFPFTGHGGKEGGSGADAELVRDTLDRFARAGVPVQKSELGAVDEGGGGTIAKYLAHRGVDIVDVGICVISMHSPFELSAKADVWAAYRGFRAWLAE